MDQEQICFFKENLSPAEKLFYPSYNKSLVEKYFPPGCKLVAMSSDGCETYGVLDNGVIMSQMCDEKAVVKKRPPKGCKFIDVSTGSEHVVGLLDNGTVIGWGDISQTPVPSIIEPPAGSKFIAISAGTFHLLALLDNGTVIGWHDGYDYTPTKMEPPENCKFIAISSGFHYGLGLLDNGTIIGCGKNDEGQAPPEKRPPDGRKFVAIRAGWFYSLGLLDNDTIIGWGSNRGIPGHLGHGGGEEDKYLKYSEYFDRWNSSKGFRPFLSRDIREEISATAIERRYRPGSYCYYHTMLEFQILSGSTRY